MGSLVMAVKLVLIVLIAALACGQQDERRVTARQRLRELFSRRRNPENDIQGERKVEAKRVTTPRGFEKHDDMIVSVSSSTSESISFSRKSVRNEVEADKKKNTNNVRQSSRPNVRQRLRFRNRNKNNKNVLIDKLLNQIEVNNQVESESTAVDRPRFKPAKRRNQIEKKAETAIN